MTLTRNASSTGPRSGLRIGMDHFHEKSTHVAQQQACKKRTAAKRKKTISEYPMTSFASRESGIQLPPHPSPCPTPVWIAWEGFRSRFFSRSVAARGAMRIQNRHSAAETAGICRFRADPEAVVPRFTPLVGVGEGDSLARSAPDAEAHHLIHHRDKLEGVWHARRGGVVARRLVHHPDELDGVCAMKRECLVAVAEFARIRVACGESRPELLRVLSEHERAILWADAGSPDGFVASDDLSAELGLAESTVRVYRARARAKMRAELSRLGHTWAAVMPLGGGICRW